MITANPYRARLEKLRGECPKPLGTTEWTAVSPREADAFDRLVGAKIDFAVHPPGPQRRMPVDRFQVLALLSGFASELGIPVATDEHITMLNYGFDDVHWHADLTPGVRFRDTVVLTEVRERKPGEFLLIKRHVIEVNG